MSQAWEDVAEGSLAYVKEQSSAFFRTDAGWSKIMLEHSDPIFPNDDPSLPEVTVSSILHFAYRICSFIADIIFFYLRWNLYHSEL